MMEPFTKEERKITLMALDFLLQNLELAKGLLPGGDFETLLDDYTVAMGHARSARKKLAFFTGTKVKNEENKFNTL